MIVDGIFYEELGEGRPLVAMHGGLGLDHQYLRPALDGWADFCRVVFYDHCEPLCTGFSAPS